MTSRLLILRPEPGASATARRAVDCGWDPVLAPLFTIIAIRWQPEAASEFDAVMMTSANAARTGGEALARYHKLPLYAVGTATAAAASRAGFANVVAGDHDASALADQLRADGRNRVLHLAGDPRRDFDETGLTVRRAIVYRSEEAPADHLRGLIGAGLVVAVHSPRAARRFADLCSEQDIDRSTVSLAAISAATVEQAGEGWLATAIADRPDDEALLAAASSLGGAGLIG
jgi:uroporphyrinogen-III synthase